MQFQPLHLDDIDKVRSFFQYQNSNTCDYTIGGMFMWRQYYRMEYAILENSFFSRLRDKNDNLYYNIPLSSDITESLTYLKRTCSENGQPMRFCTVPESYLPELEALGRIVLAREERSLGDYIYFAADLIELKGRRYSGQRNHLRQFCEHVDEWSYEPICSSNLEYVIRFFLSVYLPNTCFGEYEREENERTLELLQNFEKYGLNGGVLSANGTVAGFSVVERIHNTLYIHIEKADRHLTGAYQMLMNQTAKAFATEGVNYINREEDMGDIGLRNSKSSYHPLSILRKYTIEVK